MKRNTDKYAPYKSGFEKTTADFLAKNGCEFQYEGLRLPYTLVLKRHYVPDFRLPNGIIVETKGKFTSDDRRKHLQIRLEHPHLDIRLVFMRNNKLNKNSETHYSDWCKKHKIRYAIGGIPHKWLREKQK